MAHAPTKVGWDRSAGEWAGSCGGPTPGSLLDALSDQARGRARQRSGCAHRWQQRAVSRAASDHDATRVRSPQPLWLGAPAAYPVRRWQLSWRRRNRASCIGFVRTHHTGTRWSTMCKLSSRACRRWSASLLWTRSSAQSWDRCRSVGGRLRSLPRWLQIEHFLIVAAPLPMNICMASRLHPTTDCSCMAVPPRSCETAQPLPLAGSPSSPPAHQRVATLCPSGGRCTEIARRPQRAFAVLCHGGA